MSFDVAKLTEYVGQSLGVSDWLLITQERVTAFAHITQDEQWIHVDEARAASSQFGSTLAHGYLTLSLLSHFLDALFPEEVTVLNYGLDRVRFLTPVRVDSRIRNHVKLISVSHRSTGQLIKTENTVEIEGEAKPAMVAEFLALVLEH